MGDLNNYDDGLNTGRDIHDDLEVDGPPEETNPQPPLAGTVVKPAPLNAETLKAKPVDTRLHDGFEGLTKEEYQNPLFHK